MSGTVDHLLELAGRAHVLAEDLRALREGAPDDLRGVLAALEGDARSITTRVRNLSAMARKSPWPTSPQLDFVRGGVRERTRGG